MLNIKFIKKWHLLVMWPALIAVVIYTLSALSHPLMAWTGPQAQKRFPPKMALQNGITLNTASIVNNHQLKNAKIAKFIPYKDQILFQVTEHEQEPRRYFSLNNSSELLNHDSEQAIWLAHYYLGETPAVKNIEFKTQFDNEYSPINRLLPVYKINFDTQDNLSVFIHTETMALAGINNDWKRTLRFVFKNFHSFDWLNDYEFARLALITVLVSIITIMALTGLGFIFLIRRKSKLQQSSRRWHRRLAYVVTLPLILFSVSGIYHLLYSSIASDEYGARLTQSLDLKSWENITLEKDFENLIIQQINLVSIPVKNDSKMEPDTNIASYRVSGRSKQTSNTNTREQRFKGMAKESKSFYLDGNHQYLDEYNDKKLVQLQSEKLLNSQDLHMQLVTHFGPDYDFRNKRLPVWKISDTQGNLIFIDPATHILVDQSDLTARLERYSFGFLHKWNMITPITGRFKRDILIVITLVMTLVLSIFGYLIYRRRQR
jgi:hypothetical protein